MHSLNRLLWFIVGLADFCLRTFVFILLCDNKHTVFVFRALSLCLIYSL